MENITKAAIFFILGLLFGYGLYMVSNKLECELNKSDVETCIGQHNKLLDIVVNKSNCDDFIGFIDWNITVKNKNDI